MAARILIATIASLPVWLSAPAVVGLAVLVGLIVYVLFRIAWLYTRLRPNQQIRLPDLEKLRGHGRLRSGVRESSRRQAMRAIRARLTPYVRDYKVRRLRSLSTTTPVSATKITAKDGPTISVLLTENEIKGLDRTLRRLIEPDRVNDSRHWVDVYRTEFQSPLDRAARKRVDQCAKYVAWKTAISPNPLVDTLVTLYWSFQMFRDLCVIYNLRVGAVGTATLLWRVFLGAYIAGRLDELEEHAADGADAVFDSFGDVFPNLAKDIAGKTLAKGAAGFANYLLIRRLGARAIRMLQPLAG